MTQYEIDEAEWRNPANWHGGFYFSRQDSRAFVPRRTQALGVTINFANRTGIGFLVGTIVFVVVLVLVARQ